MVRRLLEEGDTPANNPAADFSDQLQRVPIIQGRLVEFVFPAGETVAAIEHRLGRRYLGGFVVGRDDLSVGSYAIGTPARTDLASGVSGDSAVNFAIGATAAPGADQNMIAWVF